MRLGVRKGSVLLAIQLLAFWPVWTWYVRRLMDASDEPWGLLALVTAIIFLICERPERDDRNPSLIPSAIFMLLYAALYSLLPPLPRAAIAFVAIALAAAALRLGRAFHPGVLGLFALSLPVVPSLQFYLGYPLRVFVASLVAPLMRLTGLAVVREGTCLSWCGDLISIDAPCSGIKMLWVGFYLAFTLVCFYRLDPGKTCLIGIFAFVTILIANVLRASALFYVEAGVIESPAWSHEGVGIAAFALAAVPILYCARRIQTRMPCAASSSI